jgi:peroxiredoxin
MVGFFAVGAYTVSAVVAPEVAWAGDPVKPFSLRDIDGKQVSLSDYKGKVVLLSFWATWCGPCKVEMAHLDTMYREMQAKNVPFVVLSISSDDARTSALAKRYIKQKAYTFTALLDPDATVTGSYNPSKTLPYSVLIGKDHTIFKQYSGYNPGDEVALRKDIDAALARP